jgi:hypothetical protein
MSEQKGGVTKMTGWFGYPADKPTVPPNRTPFIHPEWTRKEIQLAFGDVQLPKDYIPPIRAPEEIGAPYTASQPNQNNALKKDQ